MSKNKDKEGELIDIGKKLGKSQTKDALVKLLVQSSALLAELDQSPPQSTHNAMKGCSEALVSPALLRHKDNEVGLLVAICLSEIMRIVAPDAPYSDETLKEIFQLIVTNFKGLDDVNSSSFARRVNILETVAKVRSCVVMLDLECDDLILEMFEIFFDTASVDHPQNVFVAMRNILSLVLEESEKIPTEILEVILKNLLKTNKEGSAARKLAIAVVERSADKLEPYVRSFLTSVMVEGKSFKSGLHKDHHQVISELYGCAPQLLSGVTPNINDELVKDKVDVRLKAVELLGRLFAFPGRQFAQDYPLVFSEFLKRFSDKVADVRVAVVNCAKAYVEANPSGEQANEILAALQDRLLDYDEKVRVAVVEAFYDLAISDLKYVPVDVLRKVSERIRDKKPGVRKITVLKSLELYKSYCTKCTEGSIALDKEYEWIPGKILRCSNDKEIYGLEIVLTDPLFPATLPVDEHAKHWVLAFSTFDESEKKALQFILLQKQRLQQEMQVYLNMRQKTKEGDTPEFEKKLQSCFKSIANQFVDPPKAEDSLQKLHQTKDESVFTALATLLSPITTIAQANTAREDLLKKIGVEHPEYVFMKSLATKCGYFFFSKECVNAITKEVLVCKDSEDNKYLVATSLSLLVEIVIYSPELLADAEDDLLTLLKEPYESVKESVVHIMSKAGAYFRKEGPSTGGRSNVNLILEQLCLEGNRKQAKFAVSAIAAMSADSGLRALSVLYGRLVDKLEDNAHLPTVLQSLGCIAQNAMPIFETREDDIIKFVVRNVLRRTSPQEDAEFVPEFDVPSDHVLLKIHALKALVKSFLPKMNAHQRTRLPGLLKVLVKILACGEISDDVKTSDADKAHLRLAAAKGVLRLARRWDSQIPIDVFHMVVMTVQDQAAHVRRALLRKIHHYLKDRSLNLKYASAYVLSTVDTEKDIALEARRFMSEFIDDYRNEAYKAVTGQAEKTNLTLHPEYALVYLVHVLAHHPNFPVESGEVKPEPAAYEPFYRELLFFLRALIHQESDGKNEAAKKYDGDNVPLILAILRTIKGCENVVDRTKTETLYAICDIAILITKDIAPKKRHVETYPGVVPLPASMYKVLESVSPEYTAPESKAPVTKAAELNAAEVKAHKPNATEAMTSESKASEVVASKLNAADVKAVEANEAEVKASELNATESKPPSEVKTAELNVLETVVSESKEDKATEPSESKAAEVDESMEPEPIQTVAAEANGSKASEPEESAGPESVGTGAAEPKGIKATESAEPKAAEPKESVVPELMETDTAEPKESVAPESMETDTAELKESVALELMETDTAKPKESVALEPMETEIAEPNETKALESTESKESEPSKSGAPEPTESKLPELAETASKGPESDATVSSIGEEEKTGVTEAKKAVEGPSKVDGSHLPACFKDKGVLAKFKLGSSSKTHKPSSPRGRKRGKRFDNGETVSDAELEMEEKSVREPTPKKGKLGNDKSTKGAATVGTGVIIKGPARGGRKSVDKNESAKKSAKKPEVGKEPEEDLDEKTPAKRKRGRPKGSSRKDDGISGDEMAGASSDTTPTTSAKKGKPVAGDRSLTESGKRKPGRPAKAKSDDDVQEKSAQKKEKVNISQGLVSTPDKSAKKASAVEKSESPAWKNEGERGGDESLVGCGIKVWWPLDKRFYKGSVVDYDAKKRKHKILYNDGETEILNLTKERWELTDKKNKTSAKKEKTPATTPTLSGTKYPEPKRLKVTSKTPPTKQDDKDTLSAKRTSTPKSAKEAEKPAKVAKSPTTKEQAADAFEFDDEGVEPEAKRQKSLKASGGKQSKADKNEKTMGTSKDSEAESAKEMSEELPVEGKAVGIAEDDEPLWTLASASHGVLVEAGRTIGELGTFGSQSQ
ncbi:sister chromatid cohesion protein PDS5 homolog A isoform X1 [Physcomitrium patens]|uniref:sister chromatid cohesion protein PDS5 homolog A isoform X1 n=1 Tax=Physcomitrium patens TaxID=3218 RepID=UPI000D16B729|nr:sister chromatid cohesion protein PDS5 homolog A-A-like isoform X1 [Physcomitrium patens]|eukprot:XP_024361716.1 sister chromatid cohesion protein PDS5 homolog A-A-like isoform X1 [Physcomitrella patens]